MYIICFNQTWHFYKITAVAAENIWEPWDEIRLNLYKGHLKHQSVCYLYKYDKYLNYMMIVIFFVNVILLYYNHESMSGSIQVY